MPYLPPTPPSISTTPSISLISNSINVVEFLSNPILLSYILPQVKQLPTTSRPLSVLNMSTTVIVCSFSSILNCSLANQNNSIIKSEGMKEQEKRALIIHRCFNQRPCSLLHFLFQRIL